MVATVTASSAATVDFTSNIDNTYKQYVIVGSEVYTSSTSLDEFQMRFKAGSTVITASDYAFAIQHLHAGLNDTNVRGTGQSYMRLSGLSFKNNSNWDSQYFHIWIVGDRDSYGHNIYWTGGGGGFSDTSTNVGAYQGCGGLISNAGSSTQVDGFRFYSSNGDNITGTFKLYGLS